MCSGPMPLLVLSSRVPDWRVRRWRGGGGDGGGEARYRARISCGISRGFPAKRPSRLVSNLQLVLCILPDVSRQADEISFLARSRIVQASSRRDLGICTMSSNSSSTLTEPSSSVTAPRMPVLTNWALCGHSSVYSAANIKNLPLLRDLNDISHTPPVGTALGRTERDDTSPST